SVAAYVESGFVRLECAHAVALLGDYVLFGRGDVLWLPQPSDAPAACPSLPVRFIQAHPSQAAARVNFEIIHDSLWLSLGFHNRVVDPCVAPPSPPLPNPRSEPGSPAHCAWYRRNLTRRYASGSHTRQRCQVRHGMSPPLYLLRKENLN